MLRVLDVALWMRSQLLLLLLLLAVGCDGLKAVVVFESLLMKCCLVKGLLLQSLLLGTPGWHEAFRLIQERDCALGNGLELLLGEARKWFL